MLILLLWISLLMCSVIKTVASSPSPLPTVLAHHDGPQEGSLPLVFYVHCAVSSPSQIVFYYQSLGSPTFRARLRHPSYQAPSPPNPLFPPNICPPCPVEQCPVLYCTGLPCSVLHCTELCYPALPCTAIHTTETA